MCWENLALLILPCGLACAVWAKANVPNVGWLKKLFFKMCGGEIFKNIWSTLVSARSVSSCNELSTVQKSVYFFVAKSLGFWSKLSRLHCRPTLACNVLADCRSAVYYEWLFSITAIRCYALSGFWC